MINYMDEFNFPEGFAQMPPTPEPQGNVPAFMNQASQFLTRATPGTYEEQIPPDFRKNNLLSALLMGGIQGAAQAVQPYTGPPVPPWAQALKNVAGTITQQNQLYNQLQQNDVKQLMMQQKASIDALEAQAKMIAALNSADKGFKRPGTYQVGMMNGRTYAIQGNPNNDQLEYFDPMKRAWLTVPPQMAFMQGLINPQEAALLGVPAYTSKGAVQGAGLSAVPQNQRADLSAFDKSENILKDIEKYSKKANNFSSGPVGLGRLGGGIANVYGSLTQSNKDSSMLQTKRGELSNIIRAMGEKGTLAEGDVNRGILLIPGAFDTQEVAAQKIKDLRELFANNKQAQMSAITQPIKANSQPANVAPADPLGIRGK